MDVYPNHPEPRPRRRPRHAACQIAAVRWTARLLYGLGLLLGATWEVLRLYGVAFKTGFKDDPKEDDAPYIEHEEPTPPQCPDCYGFRFKACPGCQALIVVEKPVVTDEGVAVYNALCDLCHGEGTVRCDCS